VTDVKQTPSNLLPEHAVVAPGGTTAPEARMTLSVSDEPITLQLIEDFRAMQEGTEMMMLAALLRDDGGIHQVLDILGDVKIPAPMHRSHLGILSAITTAREFRQEPTVEDCIDYLRVVDRSEYVGSRARLLALAVMADDVEASAVELAHRVARYSRARFNAGQEVWPVALYRWYDAAGRLLYVGITEDLTTRTASHGRKSSWSAFAVRRTVVRYPDRKSAETMERYVIRDERPLFNHVHNDTPEARQRLVAYLVEHGRMDLLAPAVSRG
jgi:hypothetical protein